MGRVILIFDLRYFMTESDCRIFRFLPEVQKSHHTCTQPALPRVPGTFMLLCLRMLSVE